MGGGRAAQARGAGDAPVIVQAAYHRCVYANLSRLSLQSLRRRLRAGCIQPHVNTRQDRCLVRHRRRLRKHRSRCHHRDALAAPPAASGSATPQLRHGRCRAQHGLLSHGACHGCGEAVFFALWRATSASKSFLGGPPGRIVLHPHSLECRRLACADGAARTVFHACDAARRAAWALHPPPSHTMPCAVRRGSWRRRPCRCSCAGACGGGDVIQQLCRDARHPPPARLHAAAPSPGGRVRALCPPPGRCV